MLTDEMLVHANTEEMMGLAGALVVPFDQIARRGKILVLGDHDRSYELILDTLKDDFTPTRETNPACALLQLQEWRFRSYDHQPQLGACAWLTTVLASPLTRSDAPPADPYHQRAGGRPALAEGPRQGVNEYSPINPNELLARVRTQVKRKRYIDHLRVERRDDLSRPAHWAA